MYLFLVIYFVNKVCRSLYYVIDNYLLLLVANKAFLYLGVKRAEQQHALNDNRQ